MGRDQRRFLAAEARLGAPALEAALAGLTTRLAGLATRLAGPALAGAAGLAALTGFEAFAWPFFAGLAALADLAGDAGLAAFRTGDFAGSDDGLSLTPRAAGEDFGAFGER